MKEKKAGVKNPKVENLPPIGEDSTDIKGGVSGNYTIKEQTETESLVEKLDKNSVFALVSDYFCPVKFDGKTLIDSLKPLVSAGIMSEDVFFATIGKAKQEFLKAHDDEIKAGENLSFSEVISRLKENESLYKKVLQVCSVSEFVESNYIVDGKAKIYRANQFVNNDGTNRYNDVTLKTEVNGKTFEQGLYVESREITTSNILLAIRYFASKQEAERKLSNQVNSYNRILSDIRVLVSKAKENGFSKEQISAQINYVFG